MQNASELPAVKIPQDIMVFVTKFLSLGDTPSFTPFKIPGRGGLKNLKPDAQKNQTPSPQSHVLCTFPA